MYYEINVAKKVDSKSNRTVHFFATAPRSISSEFELKKILPVFLEKFPESEGYNVSVSRHEEIGYQLDMDEVISQCLAQREELV